MTAPGVSSLRVSLANHQRSRAVHLPGLRRIAETLLGEWLEVRAAELDVSLVSASAMTRLNETVLQHAGSTDVITFDYSERGTRNAERGTSLHGEIIICVDEAIVQARRFRTTWQSEIVRYLIHGILHLLGHDDSRPVAQRRMKRVENRLLRSVSLQLPLDELVLKSSRRVNRQS